jgi:hypothetical protein
VPSGSSRTSAHSPFGLDASALPNSVLSMKNPS